MTPKRKPLLLIVTMLGGKGPTGVETHFNQIIAAARNAGLDTKLVTPYTGWRLARAVYRPLKNFRSEIPAVWYLKAQADCLRRQLAAIARDNPDRSVVSYAQCPLSAAASVAISSREKNWRTKLVVHYNGSQALELVEKGVAEAGGRWAAFLDETEAVTLAQVDQIIFVSAYMRGIINARIPSLASRSEATIFNFPPGPLAPRTDIAEGDIVAIGTLEPRKNQLFLLQVLAAAKARGSIYRLGLVGDGPDRESLKKAANELGVAAQVSFLGFQVEAARIIPRYRCFAHAAQLENCPISILEAFSCGRPVFAAAVGGIPELFTDGVQGRFWPLENPALAAERLGEILDDPVRYATVAAAALHHYQKDFANLPARWLDLLMSSNGDRAA